LITDIYFTAQPYNDDVIPLNNEEARYLIGYVKTELESIWGTNKIAWCLRDPFYGGEAYLRTYILTDVMTHREQYENMSFDFGTRGDIFMLSNSSLVVGSGDMYVYFTPSEWSQTGGGSSDDYEKPDIGLESYDCYTNSIIAYYRIYNHDEAKVTSAKGYYGTSSASRSVNAASIGSSLITIKFSGLKPNTTYYIKCTATGKGGTGSSETTRLSTTN